MSPIASKKYSKETKDEALYRKIAAKGTLNEHELYSRFYNRMKSGRDDCNKKPRDKCTTDDSYTSVKLRFSKDLKLVDSYLRFDGDLRIGRILEDLDSLAGTIAYRQCNVENISDRSMTIVTAAVDKIILNKPILPYFDVTLTGFVTWTGNSSMEIRVEVTQDTPHDEDKSNICMVGRFVMVARHPFQNKSVQIPQLTPVTKNDKFFYTLGKKLTDQRKQKRKESLETTPPTKDELSFLHSFFIDSRSNQNKTISSWMAEITGPSLVPPNQGFLVPMATTMLRNSKLMMPQHRNVHQKVFGGYLMRQAYELAWQSALFFSKSKPSFYTLDDNFFIKSVEVGSSISFTAMVVYAQDDVMILRVDVEVLNPVTDHVEKTNCFHFGLKGHFQHPVVPRTYEEAIAHLEGKRIYDSLEYTHAMILEEKNRETDESPLGKDEDSS